MQNSRHSKKLGAIISPAVLKYFLISGDKTNFDERFWKC